MHPRYRLIHTLLFVVGFAHAATAQTTTPARSLARYVPQGELVFLVEFDGLDAHNAAWSRSAANHVLNDTSLGLMLEDLVRQGIDLALKSSPPAGRPTSNELLDLIKRTIKGGITIAVRGKPGTSPPSLVFILGGGAKNGSRALFERMTRGGANAPTIKTEVRGRRSVSVIEMPNGKGPVWWSEGNDLIVTNGDSFAAIVDVIDRQKPNASTHPIRAELAKSDDGFETALRAFVDMSAIPIPPKEAQATGLSGLKRLDFRWGFQDNALMSVFRLVAPAPRKGLVALFDGSTFDKNTLPPLPADLHGFSVLSLKPGDLFDKVLNVAKALDPKAGTEASRLLDQFRSGVGFDLRNDLLGHLGPRIVWAMKPAQPNQPIEAFLLAQVDDPASLAKVMEKLAPLVNGVLKSQPGPANRPVPQLKKVTQGVGAGMTWTLDLPPGIVPPSPATAGLKPTLRIGKSWMAIAARPEATQKLIANLEGGGRKWSAVGDYAALARRLPSNLVYLSIEDPRDTVPQILTNLPTLLNTIKAQIEATQRGAGARGPSIPLEIKPGLVPTANALAGPMFPSSMAITTSKDGVSIVARESVPSITSAAPTAVVVALLLPAVQAAREAARRAQCVNNLKQIGLAMHNYHDTNNAFPMPAIMDKAGKPLLSWRVAILPYIEAGELYKEFHLNEAWDSPHNKTLIARMPKTYQCPSRPIKEPGMTSYRGFVGEGAMMEPGHATKIAEITDGTSNTLLVAESSDEVPWTKPDEMSFVPNNPARSFGAGSKHPGGFNALMADGSVRFFKTTINSIVFKALITRSGGEVIGDGAF